MPDGLDVARSARRARHRVVLRTLAWVAVAFSVVNLVAMWLLARFVSGVVPPALLLAGTGASIGVYLAGLLIPLTQQEALKALPTPTLLVAPVEPWAEGILSSRQRRRAQWLGTPFALSIVCALVIRFWPGLPPMTISVAWSLLPMIWTVLAIALATRGVNVLTAHWLLTGRDERVRWLLRHGPGVESMPLLSLCLHILNAPRARDVALMQGSRAGTVRTYATRAALLSAAASAEPAETRDGFAALHRAVPEAPLGALGYAETRLAQGMPATDACQFAVERSRTSLRFGHLALYAEANLARSLALAGDQASATAQAQTVLEQGRQQPARRHAALLHRLSLVYDGVDDAQAHALRQRATALDPTSRIGRDAAAAVMPAPFWV